MIEFELSYEEKKIIANLCINELTELAKIKHKRFVNSIEVNYYDNAVRELLIKIEKAMMP